jgi:hypothetical protein
MDNAKALKEHFGKNLLNHINRFGLFVRLDLFVCRDWRVKCITTVKYKYVWHFNCNKYSVGQYSLSAVPLSGTLDIQKFRKADLLPSSGLRAESLYLKTEIRV